MVSIGFLKVELATAQFWSEVRAALPGLRAAAGLSQRQLARILGTTQGNVSSAEHGREEAWGTERTIAWLRAVGQVLAVTSPEGETLLVDRWDRESGRWVQNVRLVAGLSQGALAELVGVSKSTIQTIEARGVSARFTTLIAILIACGWSVELRPANSRTPVPAGPSSAEERKTWRHKARGRALTRLARGFPGEYRDAYIEAQSSGGGLSAQRARDAALSDLARAHPDQFQDLYRDELRRSAAKGEAPSGRGTAGSLSGEGKD